MYSRIIKAGLFVGFATILPLIGRPEIIVHPKIVIVLIAGLAMILTQPDLKGSDAQRRESTDRWSVVAILLAGIISQVLPIVEWGYTQEIHSGNQFVTAIGLGMIIGGLAFRIWSIRTLGKFFTATVQIVDGHRVIKHGPYAIVRHPSYLGAFVAIVGSGVFLNAPMGTLCGAVAVGAAYIWRITVEERTLTSYFGDEYRLYSRRVKAILPGIL